MRFFRSTNLRFRALRRGFSILAITLLCISCGKETNNPEQKNAVAEAKANNVDSAQIAAEKNKMRLASSGDVDALQAISSQPLAPGKHINIAIIGVDSRIGDNVKHADANHILSVNLDSGTVDIISIPRDTPAEAGYKDTLEALNKLTMTYSRGINKYFYEARKIAGLDTIPYFVEFGFSQAMGVMELLGYKDPTATLRVLRSRKGLGGDDFQRSYNQGQFIRQAMLKNFERLDGVFGDVLLRAGLLLVNTNLTTAKSNEIIAALKAKGFPKSPDDVTVLLRPTMRQQFNVYDFTDEEVITKLRAKVDNYANYLAEHDTATTLQGKPDVTKKLQGIIQTCFADTAKRSAAVAKRLETPFLQRAWLQIEDKEMRKNIRTQIATLLTTAYQKTGAHDKARRVQEALKAEEELFGK